MKTLDRLMRARERNRWLCSALTALLTLAAVLAVSNLTFETNDDCSIIAVAAGYLTGSPNPATVSTGYGYGALLAGLYGLCGALPWHTLILLTLNAASLTALAMGCFTLCAEYGASFLWGAGAYLSLFLGVLLPFTAQLQFSAVAGLSFTAALLLTATLPRAAGRRATVLRLGAAAVLTLFAFGLRPNVALMLCPLWALLGAGALLRRAPRRRVTALFAACALVALGGLFGLEQTLYGAQAGWAEFEAFDRQATDLLDYNAYPLTAEQLHSAAQAAGWSDELLGMARNWYFLDSRIDVAPMAKLNEALRALRPGSGATEPAAVLRATGSIALHYPMFRWNLLGWGAAALAGVAVSLRRRRGWLAAQIAANIGYGLLLIAYFYGVLGRFPLRLGFAVACPSYALLLPLLIDAFFGNLKRAPVAENGRIPAEDNPAEAGWLGASDAATPDGIAKTAVAVKADVAATERSESVARAGASPRATAGLPTAAAHSRGRVPLGGRWGAAALAALLLGGVLTFAQNPESGLSPRGRQTVSQSNAALADAIDRYAAAHAGQILITDYCQNFSPTAVYAPGQFANLIYWGSGISRSPAAVAQLRALGVTEMTAERFFDDGVYILLAGGEGPRAALSEYLTADYGLRELRLVEQTDAFAVYRALR